MHKIQKKGECFIIVKRIRYYGKTLLKIAIILGIAVLIVVGVLLKKYKSVYKVTLNGEVIGYVEDKKLIEKKIDEYQNNLEGNIVSIDIPNRPEYELEFVSEIESTDEEKVLLAIEEASEVTCKVYAIKLDDEVKAEVNTKEEANKVVEDIKAGVDSDLEINLSIDEQLKNKKELESSISTSEVAMATINEDVTKKVDEYEAQKAEEAAIAAAEAAAQTTTSRNSSYSRSYEEAEVVVPSNFSGGFITPVAGTLTSPYGYRSSGFHTGIDLATDSGTPIAAAAAGTVSFAGWSGGYGNLVIIDHGDGYQTYYAHCSAIYVQVGQSVSAGTTISAVGSTGNSTGPHLHFEVRINGSTVNPQNYI